MQNLQAVCQMVAASTPRARQPVAVPNTDPTPVLMSGQFFASLMDATIDRNPELRLFATIARNRLAADPNDVITLGTLNQFRVRAFHQGYKKALQAFDTLIELAHRGELGQILQGERTPTVRAAVHRKLRRYGEAKFDLNDSVIVKESGDRGVIVDYLSDSREYVVQVSHWKTLKAKPGDLMKTAHRAREEKAAVETQRARWTQAIQAQLSPYNDVVHGTLRIVNFAPRALSAARDKILGAGLLYPPEFRFMGFSNVRHNDDNSIQHADAVVLVAFPTNLGPRVELRVPVPIRNGEMFSPEQFILGGKAYPLDERGLGIALHGYGLPPRPRHFRPFQSPPAMLNIPDTNVRGMFGPPRTYPRKHPGRPTGGDLRVH